MIVCCPSQTWHPTVWLSYIISHTIRFFSSSKRWQNKNSKKILIFIILLYVWTHELLYCVVCHNCWRRVDKNTTFLGLFIRREICTLLITKNTLNAWETLTPDVPSITNFSNMTGWPYDHLIIYIFLAHLTHDMWQMTCDMWHVTCDTWHMTGGGGELSLKILAP